jgi:hypothetical protein
MKLRYGKSGVGAIPDSAKKSEARGGLSPIQMSTGQKGKALFIYHANDG